MLTRKPRYKPLTFGFFSSDPARMASGSSIVVVSIVSIAGRLTGMLPNRISYNYSLPGGYSFTFLNPLLIYSIFPAGLTILFLVDEIQATLRQSSLNPKTEFPCAIKLLTTLNFYTAFTAELFYRLLAVVAYKKCKILLVQVVKFEEETARKIGVSLRLGRGSILRSKYFHGGVATLICCIAGEAWGIIRVGLERKVENVWTHSFVFSTENRLHDWAYALVAVLPVISATFSILFIVLVGLQLVQFHENFLEESLLVMGLHQGHINVLPVKRLWTSNEPRFDRNLVGTGSALGSDRAKRFSKLKQMFKNYSTVAGLYGGLLIAKCTVKLFEVVCAFTVQENDDVVAWKISLFQLISRLGVVIYLANFGDYLNRKVGQQNETKITNSIKVIRVMVE